jgi:hypothetical protein
MEHHRETVTSFVLMPFSNSYTFVYEYGIKPALAKLAGDPNSITVARADEKLALSANKVQEVEAAIRSNDIIVIDLSDYNPNVLWELGYCQALGKRIIPISQSIDGLPFNLRGLDVINYEFSLDGMERLKQSFTDKLEGLLGTVAQARGSLHADPVIAQLTSDIDRDLTDLRADSVLRTLARNEIRRLQGRIRALTAGQFDLRNEKPNKEIIEYYCDYLSQLDGSDSSFDTVTFHGFWQEITDGGNAWDYLEANIHAVQRGVTIRRSFILDEDVISSPSIPSILYKILVRLKNAVDEYDKKGVDEHSGKLEIRLLWTDEFDDDRSVYGNFGILKRRSEQLLFKPEYAADGRMRQTKFTYFDERDARKAEENETELRKYESRFRTVWDKSHPITDDDLERCRTSSLLSE